MARGMTRRGLLATPAASALAAPSGDVTAIVVADGEELRPTIRDASGAPVWIDDLPHVDRYFPGVVWESDADVMWVLSTDHGNGSVRRAEDGSWERTMGDEGMPPDIAELAR